MRAIRLALSLALILGMAGGVMAQQSGGTSASKPGAPDIMQSLGKLKLEDIKKGVTGGTEAVVTPAPRSRMAQLKVDKSFTEPGGKAVYYFSRGLLVSAAAKAAKPLTKEQLLREIKDLKFEKLPPNQVEAAFVRRSATVIQGFILSSDGKYVEMTTFDYVPK
jgi:hypothetical protein